MGFFRKKKEMRRLASLPENDGELKKLSLFVTVVSRGQADPVVRLFETLGVSAQFIENGEGTAQREIRNILGIEDDRKSIVFSFIKRDAIPEATKELEAFFLSSPKNKGIGYSIPINSLIGMQLYRFLADTL